MKKLLKICTLILLLTLYCTLLRSQTDTTKYSIFDLTIESGVFFPHSDNFQTFYNSKSCFNWSLGVKIRKDNWNYYPWIKFSKYQSSIDSVFINGVTFPTSIAKRNQVSLGVINQMKITNNHYILLKCGVSYNFMNESSTNLKTENYGYIISIGYIKKLTKWFSYHIDINYDYSNTKSSLYFKDWSGMLINFGLSFKILANPENQNN